MQAKKSTDSQKFSDRLRIAIAREGIQKSELARAIGAHPVSVSRWLKGRQPDYETALRLASRLKVRLLWLTRGDPPMELDERELALAASRAAGGHSIRETAEPLSTKEEPVRYGASPEEDRLHREIMERLNDASLSSDELVQEALKQRVEEYIKVQKAKPKPKP